MRGLSNMRVDVILDPDTQRLIAIHMRMNFQEMERTIWMDRSPHPPDLAPHTFPGFSTGTWDRNMLNVYTRDTESRRLPTTSRVRIPIVTRLPIGTGFLIKGRGHAVQNISVWNDL